MVTSFFMFAEAIERQPLICKILAGLTVTDNITNHQELLRVIAM